MKEEIINHLNEPRQLERLYRANRTNFRQAFDVLYPEIKGNVSADFWKERLHYETDELNRGSAGERWFVIFAALCAGIMAKLPAILSIDDDLFYPRNIGFILLPVLTIWFAWKNGLSAGKIAFLSASFIFAALFINFLPDENTSDTTVLSCIHLILFLWSLLGFAFTGGGGNNNDERLGFLRYNGDLVVISTLIAIAGLILSGITIGLFSLIGFNIENFYFQNIVVFALPAVPILGTFLTRTNPQLVGKISPVIAKIFSPLVLVMLTVYLVAMVYSGKDPYNDREFLLIFNALLVGVMAIIFFSVAGTNSQTKTQTETWILLLLSVVTVVVNGIALSAIVFRISEWGITPNRAAVLGGNILILINLLLVSGKLFGSVRRRSDTTGVGRIIGYYLPVYCVWTIIVTFVFPLIFEFK